MRDAGEVAHHHPEAVVEGHRDADPVCLGVAAHLADEVAVVEDVAVAERGALGIAGRAGGVLDVDRVVGSQRGLARGQVVVADALAVGDQARPAVGVVEVHDALEGRVVLGRLLDHRAVVARAERRRAHQHPHAALVDGVGELVGAVGRVDVDQDRADPRRGELHERPLGAVRTPDADPVPGLDPRTDQATREGGDVPVELGPRPASPARALDERLAVGVRRHGPREAGADRLLQQRRRGLSLGVGIHARQPTTRIRCLARGLRGGFPPRGSSPFLAVTGRCNGVEPRGSPGSR